MRKKISIFLFCITVISAFGLYPVLKLLQYEAKEAAEKIIRQQIPEKDLAVFVNPQSNNEVEWEEADEEFHYRGNMYDVVKKETREGKDFYFCYNDSKEALIFSGLEDLLSKQLRNSHELPGPVEKCLLKLFVQVFMPSDKLMLYMRHGIDKPARPLFTIPLYCNASREIISPPPELA